MYDKIKSLDAEIQAEKQIKREQTVELEAIIEKKSQELHMQEENIVQLEAHVVELEETVAQRSKYNELEDTIVKLKRDVLKKEKQGQKQIKAIMEVAKSK